MKYVESHHLLNGHTFQLKETLQIRIAEEANLCLSRLRQSEAIPIISLSLGGIFHLCATYSVQCCWQVSNACCREGDNFNIIPQNHRVFEEKGLQAPFKSKWVGQRETMLTVNKIVLKEEMDRGGRPLSQACLDKKSQLCQ
jgi:hypothetical protein